MKGKNNKIRNNYPKVQLRLLFYLLNYPIVTQ